MADRGTWKIVIAGATLIDYADVAVPHDNDGGPLIQAEALFRSTSKAYFERNNLENTLVFSLDFIRANNAASMLFWLTGPQTWSGVKTVALTHIDHASAEATKTITGAAVRLRCSPPVGVSNLAILTITGGLIS